MKKRLLPIFLCVILIPLISGCSISGLSEGYKGKRLSGGEVEFQGFVALKIEKTKYDVNDFINVRFNYGHNYPDYYELDRLISHKLEVYLTSSLSGNTDSEDEWVILYEKEFDDSEFINVGNKCEVNEKSLGNVEIKYNKGFDLEIDFSNIGFDKGKLVIRMTESKYASDLINGETNYREVTTNRQSSLYFQKDTDEVMFSMREIKENK